MDTTLRLHVWPSQWHIPSAHPQCLAAIIYAQLTIPGKFEVHECTNPDSSPNGLLPYVTHGQTALATLSSIVKYISNMRDGDLDASLSGTEKAQRTAWAAFVETHLGDLVACSFYAITENFIQCTRPALASHLSLPQRYYLPDRLRESYQPRLEAAGLWDVDVERTKKEKGPGEGQRRGGAASLLLREKVQQTFAKEKVISKARLHLDILANLLNNRKFVFKNGPTSLDALLAAHILLLTRAPLPNGVFSHLIEDAYPTLLAHAQRVHASAFGGPDPPSSPLSTSVSFLGSPPPPPLKVVRATHGRFAGLIPHWRPSLSLPPSWSSRASEPHSQTNTDSEAPTAKEKDAAEASEAEARAFARVRWGFAGVSLAAVVGWCVLSGLLDPLVGSVRGGYDVPESEDEDEHDEGTGFDNEEEEEEDGLEE